MNLKTDFECLEMIHNKSSCDCIEIVKVINYENCEVFNEKVKYFIKIVSKFFMGTTNLKALLGSQNCVFNKAGISFRDVSKKKVKKFKNYFNHNGKSTSPFVSCFYCMERGHTVRHYRVRLHYLPKGLVKWVPEGTINKIGPKFNMGSKKRIKISFKTMESPPYFLWKTMANQKNEDKASLRKPDLGPGIG